MATEPEVVPQSDSSLLSDIEIMDAIEDGDIVISGFRKEQLQGYYYILRLGNFHFRARTQGYRRRNKDDKKNNEIWYKYKTGPTSVHMDVPVLCHTEEIIGCFSGCIPEIVPLPILTRYGVGVISSRYEEVGRLVRPVFTLVNCLAFDFHLKPGTPIARVIFHRSSKASQSRLSQKEIDLKLDNFIDSWTPEKMLPPGCKGDIERLSCGCEAICRCSDNSISCSCTPDNSSDEEMKDPNPLLSQEI